MGFSFFLYYVLNFLGNFKLVNYIFLVNLILERVEMYENIDFILNLFEIFFFRENI